MAAASHLNVLHPERKASFGIAQPPSLAMHATRPKSAKGRTRPSVNYSHGVVEAYSSYPVPSSPQPLPPPCEEAVSSRRASSSQQLYPPGQAFAPEIPDLLQQVPLRTSSSLNKYRVLPSISRKELRKSAAEAMPEGASSPVVEEEARSPKDLPVRGKGPSRLLAKHKGGAGEHPRAPPPPPPPLETKPSSRTPEGALLLLLLLPLPPGWEEEPREGEPRLLLAIRSPSGQRFERHFRPTDSLAAVLAAAEQQNSTAYRRCSIKTVEVPRRTFSDLSKSLRECAIPHKSVLCILQEDQEGEP
ncbi:hypothetical protein JRQ81_009913 [Phrynocephalus forsythii]|uniref:UBX domain-containing protein n=1 Tax=Phrynocephalus forsythii TaxID=171643 RepID=A0A9Q1ARK1_9SAUR|nr:hypothetical protein JRQ81_009913 [Phrynocephalus forsythii]